MLLSRVALLLVQLLSSTCTVAFKVSPPTVTTNEYKRQYAETLKYRHLRRRSHVYIRL